MFISISILNGFFDLSTSRGVELSINVSQARAWEQGYGVYLCDETNNVYLSPEELDLFTYNQQTFIAYIATTRGSGSSSPTQYIGANVQFFDVTGTGTIPLVNCVKLVVHNPDNHNVDFTWNSTTMTINGTDTVTVFDAVYNPINNTFLVMIGPLNYDAGGFACSIITTSIP